MHSSRKPALTFIFITLLIDVIGLGIIIPIMPDLIIELAHLDANASGSLSYASKMGAWLLFAYAFIQFLCAPVIGALSDNYGRRPVLLGSLMGFTIDYLFLSFAPNITWLFVGRVVAGIMGASFTTGGAYIADISAPEERAKNFGLIGAAFGLGFIIGPVLGGFLGSIGLRVPFMVSAGLTFLNFLFGLFVLPESLKPENRRKFEWKRANPIGTLLSLKRYPLIIGLMGSLTFLYIAAHAVQSNWPYYTKEKFGWELKEVGISLAVVGLAFAIIQGALIRVIIPKLGQLRSVNAGMTLYTLSFVLYAFASQGWMMYGIIVIYCLGSIAMTGIQGIMSGIVEPNAQGELQGGFTSLMSLTAIIGPLLMNYVFSYFVSAESPVYFPGAAMMLGAVLTLVSFVLIRVTLKKRMAN
ncbi:MAG: TCR/Tet family MFS transporter [Cyclobacteriaceae bacterium]|nr:TCR/Tet family MFS transporter [Cyclobacteriaceae bacterium]